MFTLCFIKKFFHHLTLSFNIPKSLQAADLRPNDARSHTNLGAILHLLGQTQQAVLSYKTALSLQPGDLTTLGNLKKLGFTENS